MESIIVELLCQLYQISNQQLPSSLNLFHTTYLKSSEGFFFLVKLSNHWQGNLHMQNSRLASPLLLLKIYLLLCWSNFASQYSSTTSIKPNRRSISITAGATDKVLLGNIGEKCAVPSQRFSYSVLFQMVSDIPLCCKARSASSATNNVSYRCTQPQESLFLSSSKIGITKTFTNKKCILCDTAWCLNQASSAAPIAYCSCQCRKESQYDFRQW